MRLQLILMVVVSIFCLHTRAVRVSTHAKQFVCTETFKAGLTSFFTQQDTKAAFAEDQSELCEMCAKITRLAFLYSNDVQTMDKWATALESNACNFVGSSRRSDCKALTRGVIAAQRGVFDSKKARFTAKELKGTTEQLGMMVDSRSYNMCKQIGCCRLVPKVSSKPLLEPCSKPGDRAEVDKDRNSLQKDRFYLDTIRNELFDQRRLNNQVRAKLDLKDTDLKSREKSVKKDREVLKKDQQKYREALNALKRREDRVKRREEREQKLEEYNKKKEKWIKEREEIVKDREDICYKREEQLGVPHPPKTRPPPLPPAPEAPPGRPPSL